MKNRTLSELMTKSAKFVDMVSKETELHEVDFIKDCRISVYCKYNSNVARYCVKKKWEVKITDSGHFNADKTIGGVWVHIGMW